MLEQLKLLFIYMSFLRGNQRSAFLINDFKVISGRPRVGG
jgi:hypothetical protein